MPEDTRAARIGIHARGVFSEVQSLLAKAIAAKLVLWGGSVLSGIGALAAWLVNITIFERGVLLGASGTFGALVLALLSIGAWRYFFRKLPEAPVPSETIMPWRDLHGWWEPVFKEAYRFLEEDVCNKAQGGDPLKLSLFARTCALKPFRDSSVHLARLLIYPSSNFTKENLEALEEQFRIVLMGSYRDLLSWLDAVGESVLGRDGLEKHPRYVALRESHRRAVKTMEQNRPDIGIARDWIATLEGLIKPEKTEAPEEPGADSKPPSPPS